MKKRKWIRPTFDTLYWGDGSLRGWAFGGLDTGCFKVTNEDSNLLSSMSRQGMLYPYKINSRHYSLDASGYWIIELVPWENN